MLLVNTTGSASGVTQTVVFVNRYFYPDQSATSQLLTDLVQGLMAHGFAVHVVCSRQLYDDPSVRLPAREQIFGARIHRLSTTRFGRHRLIGRAVDYATFYLFSAFALMRILRHGDVLVVKTDPPLMSLPAVLIASSKGATLVNWQQDVFPEVASLLGANPLPKWLDGLLRRLRNASLKSSHMNVVIGTRMRDHFTASGIPSSKLCVIENWADANAIKPKSSGASELRARLGLGDRFVACYSGNLGRAHEFDTLLKAAETLRLERTFVFLIIGGGAKMAALKRAVAERALDNFCFLPYQPRAVLEDSLAAADVHLISLLPELEGLIVPSKLYGVLAAGRPLIYIGDSNGDVARAIESAGCGMTIKVGDSRALTDSLRHLHAEPDTRLQMGQRARQLFCDKYTLQQAIQRWIAMLHGRA
jgi:colanic acid biosynthesis glycosyl transferase WcaI